MLFNKLVRVMKDPRVANYVMTRFETEDFFAAAAEAKCLPVVMNKQAITSLFNICFVSKICEPSKIIIDPGGQVKVQVYTQENNWLLNGLERLSSQLKSRLS